MSRRSKLFARAIRRLGRKRRQDAFPYRFYSGDDVYIMISGIPFEPLGNFFLDWGRD